MMKRIRKGVAAIIFVRTGGKKKYLLFWKTSNMN